MADAVVRRAAAMPFGAEVGPHGVRFRLWAPGAARVDLVLGDPRHGVEERETDRLADGFWQLEHPAGAGTLYGYRVDGGPPVPDPASRYQPRDVHGPSEVIDPRSFAWNDAGWSGRPWEETVLYELHAGAFSRQGGYDGVRRGLDRLAALGVTAIELMPLSDFPGTRNWGYDGVLPYAPDSSYGRPDELKRLVAAAHRRGLMVFLDVVYNHFGPEGNYLHRYARPFFHPDATTPWGDAIRFDGPDSATVRRFFIHNALYWLEEYHLDGLRVDAVHAIHDESSPSFLDELAARVQAGPGARRHVHLVLENVANEARWLRRAADDRTPRCYVAQWNDDVHHALHCLLTGERGGYYADFVVDPARRLARALAEGFAWQGEHSSYRGGPRGEASAHLPPTAFVGFLQNHDQVGNRAFGERLTVLAGERSLAAAVAVLLLAPAPPLLFMGEEYGCRRPFPFFCDFGPELARAVTEGRRRGLARFVEFAGAADRGRIPDPNLRATFESAVLDDDERETAVARRWLAHYRTLLELRRREIVPRLAGCAGHSGRWNLAGERTPRVEWELGDGAKLTLIAHLDDGDGPRVELPRGRLLWPATGPLAAGAETHRLDAWEVLWLLDEARR
ncbi:MAG TPA: malto-oligosyltrehalose trehalohydrolase [Candidatus Polarisedimenticolaceae bacterium]|nr:malto-oligosyltrehalose trehalohydrolase [Candidatus Polarisedimenticolaceae bacterium]